MDQDKPVVKSRPVAKNIPIDALYNPSANESVKMLNCESARLNEGR